MKRRIAGCVTGAPLLAAGLAGLEQASAAPEQAAPNDNAGFEGTMPKITSGHTVAFDEGDKADRTVTGSGRGDRHYSVHRAVMARVHH